MKSGYNAAIALAEEKLKTLDPLAVCERTGAKWNGSTYLIPWLGGERELYSGNDAEIILWLHYLAALGSKTQSGKWISYREVPSALFYEPKFIARAVKPIVKSYGSCPSKLVDAAKKLGGVKANAGDAAVTINLLPFIPVTYIVWAGDEEMEAAGNILFDKTAVTWLPAEDLVVLASQGAYALAGLSGRF